MAEISLYAPGESPLAQGDSFTLYEDAEDVDVIASDEEEVVAEEGDFDAE